MTAAEFRAWRQRRGWTQKEAAAALGLSDRMVQFLEAAAKPVSTTVALLCLAYDKGFKAPRR